jgi:hypothetical protein
MYAVLHHHYDTTISNFPWIIYHGPQPGNVNADEHESMHGLQMAKSV